MQNVVAEISLKRIVQNADLIRERTAKPLIAVVKDDGYGHGAAEVAHALFGRANTFAVSSVEEGAALRTAGIAEEILVLTPVLSEEEALRAFAYGLIVTASSLASLRILLRARERFGGEPRVHLAVNTGMNRYGFRPERVGTACKILTANGIEAEGVYSHYYAPESRAALNAQRRIFARAADEVREYFPDCMRHIAATGGALGGGELFDAVRVGIALYGYLPAGFEEIGLKPAMRVYATVAQAGTFLGGGAGYGAAREQYGKLHTLRLGYGDGFFRAGGLGIGKLCMDACVREGDARFGRRKLVFKDAREYARRMDTNEYEVLTGIGKRAVRIYV